MASPVENLQNIDRIFKLIVYARFLRVFYNRACIFFFISRTGLPECGGTFSGLVYLVLCTWKKSRFFPGLMYLVLCAWKKSHFFPGLMYLVLCIWKKSHLFLGPTWKKLPFLGLIGPRKDRISSWSYILGRNHVF